MKYDTTLENYVGTQHDGRLDSSLRGGSREMQVDLSELDGDHELEIEIEIAEAWEDLLEEVEEEKGNPL